MLRKTEYATDPELISLALTQLPTEDFKFTINEQTGDFFYDPWKIKSEFVDSVWGKLISTLPFNVGEARIIILKHGVCYQSHGDIDDRYHLNLCGQYSYIINLQSEEMFELHTDNTWYEMNAGPRHTAANFGNSDRVQLVVRKLLSRNELSNPVSIKMSYIGTNKYGVRFTFDDVISPWLNTANKDQIITDFSFQHNDVRFKIEDNKLNELLNILPKDFKVDIL